MVTVDPLNMEFVLITKYYYADQVKASEVGRVCGTHGRGEESVQSLRKETTQKTEAQMGEWAHNGS
jgi:hypothetical protein